MAIADDHAGEIAVDVDVPDVVDEELLEVVVVPDDELLEVVDANNGDNE